MPAPCHRRRPRDRHRRRHGGLAGRLQRHQGPGGRGIGRFARSGFGQVFPSYLNDGEWAFVNAVVDHLIPADDLGPGALEAGVPEFIDRQLETPWGYGRLWYMQGPFQPDAVPEMGYQNNMTPRDIFRHGIADCDAWCRQNRGGKTFATLDKAQQEEVLHLMDDKKIDLPNVPTKLFFTYLLTGTRQGFFADPIYGGNKGMVGWKLIGFPGARADFMDWIDQPNKPYPFGPVSINGARA
ncbi:gluconate 2-dehydrogenase subunit 3 family protein [Xylophilus rhododendri]|uniref:Gluconate 2-dehydrogenase subunit 3 family protein n=1 Tax=Xylophilus rhododendri TaxID=2697032 RepID=A0A857JF18_9BURK|nr:gluconate 2-dehydrogenase subunit 3 family protein [Xylophilus rhododendri]